MHLEVPRVSEAPSKRIAPDFLDAGFYSPTYYGGVPAASNDGYYLKAD